MPYAFGSYPRTNRRVPHTPDFLWSFVGSLNFMRLSLKERRTRGPVQSTSVRGPKTMGDPRFPTSRC